MVADALPITVMLALFTPRARRSKQIAVSMTVQMSKGREGLAKPGGRERKLRNETEMLRLRCCNAKSRLIRFCQCQNNEIVDSSPLHGLDELVGPSVEMCRNACHFKLCCCSIPPKSRGTHIVYHQCLIVRFENLIRPIARMVLNNKPSRKKSGRKVELSLMSGYTFKHRLAGTTGSRLRKLGKKNKRTHPVEAHLP